MELVSRSRRPNSPNKTTVHSTNQNYSSQLHRQLFDPLLFLAAMDPHSKTITLNHLCVTEIIWSTSIWHRTNRWVLLGRSKATRVWAPFWSTRATRNSTTTIHRKNNQSNKATVSVSKSPKIRLNPSQKGNCAIHKNGKVNALLAIRCALNWWRNWSKLFRCLVLKRCLLKNKFRAKTKALDLRICWMMI